MRHGRRRPSRLNQPLAIGAVIVALMLGLVVGGALDIGKRLFGGPDPETVASSALQSMRAQNRLVPFVARYVSVVSSRQERLGGLVSSERTLILPAMCATSSTSPSLVRTTSIGTLQATRSTSPCRRSRSPGRGRSGRGARIWRGRGAVDVTNADEALDRNNRARGRRRSAQAGRRRSADAAGARGRPTGGRAELRIALQAAGFDKAKVVARYATEGSPVTEPLDRSRAYNDVLDEAR
jgi:hypothetical protein